MVVVDSSVLIDFMAGRASAHTRWLAAKAADQPIGLPDLVVCEVLQGLRNEQAAELAVRILGQFEWIESCGSELAIMAARNFRFLRSRGIAIRSLADSMVASLCLRNGWTLLHRDRDFDPYEKFLGLSVVHPDSTM